jgi:hypothetical protein
MAVPIAPAGFQGDLTDPITGTRIYRLEAWWELLLRQTSQQAPIQMVTQEAPALPPTVQWVWTGDGFLASQTSLGPTVDPLV